MKNIGSSFKVYVLAGVILAILIAGRSYPACSDFTYFFVGGTDFVNADETPAPVWLQAGQGYDGQFFYRLALDPLNFSKTAFGVTLDVVPYRVQRIMYPLLSWMLSFGGIPWLVPYALVFINVLAFFGILYFFNAIIKLLSGVNEASFLPLLLCGIYMSVARDLSEVTELFFFTATVYYLFKKAWGKFALLASLTLLSRETALIALGPIVFVTIFMQVRDKTFTLRSILLLVPFFIFGLWKFYISVNTDPVQGTGVLNNIGIPLAGIIDGFRGNFDITSLKNKLQLLFWLLYFVWHSVLTFWIIRLLIRKPYSGDKMFISLAAAWLCWFVFSLFLSPAIYVDDWSFVRVFSLWNMIGFLLIIIRNRPIPPLFRYYSVLLVVLTLARLIIRA